VGMDSKSLILDASQTISHRVGERLGLVEIYPLVLL